MPAAMGKLSCGRCRRSASKMVPSPASATQRRHTSTYGSDGMGSGCGDSTRLTSKVSVVYASSSSMVVDVAPSALRMSRRASSVTSGSTIPACAASLYPFPAVSGRTTSAKNLQIVNRPENSVLRGNSFLVVGATVDDMMGKEPRESGQRGDACLDDFSFHIHPTARRVNQRYGESGRSHPPRPWCPRRPIASPRRPSARLPPRLRPHLHPPRLPMREWRPSPVCSAAWRYG